MSFSEAVQLLFAELHASHEVFFLLLNCLLLLLISLNYLTILLQLFLLFRDPPGLGCLHDLPQQVLVSIDCCHLALHF